MSSVYWPSCTSFLLLSEVLMLTPQIIMFMSMFCFYHVKKNKHQFWRVLQSQHLHRPVSLFSTYITSQVPVLHSCAYHMQR